MKKKVSVNAMPNTPPTMMVRFRFSLCFALDILKGVQVWVPTLTLLQYRVVLISASQENKLPVAV